MKHALRKYIAPCGSALFMVVSTMAALVVLVTAMYMSVVSSGKVQMASFNQEQAYVTSTSIGDMVYSYLMKSSEGRSFVTNNVLTLKKNEHISTNGNDFEAFGGANPDLDRIGAFDVDITYVYDIGTQKVFDMAVTVENGGVYETSHTFLKVTPGSVPTMRRIDNFFTSTGYLPTDIWIKKVVTDSEVYFDNEYVKMTDFSKSSASQDMVYNFDITALGTVEMDVGKTGNQLSDNERSATPLTWTIGIDYKLIKGDIPVDLCGTSSNHGKLYVGRDMYIEGTQHYITQYSDVYVMGDLYLNTSNCVNLNGDLYVNGNIIRQSGNLNVNGKVYLNGNVVDGSGNPASINISAPSWDTSEAEAFMDMKLSPSPWPKWTLKRVEDEIDLSFRDSENDIVYIDSDGTLGDWINASGHNQRVIIIDTGDDISDVRNLTISANDSTGEMFSWDPFDGDATAVLTVGKGTLVINVPDDVAYQDKRGVFFGHIAWFTACGGTIDIQDGKLKFGNISTAAGASTSFAATCKDNHFIVNKSDLKNYGETGACEYKEKTVDVTINGETESRTYYTCTKHGGWYDVDNKKTGKNTEIEAYEAGEGGSLCAGRINESGFDSFYAGSGSGALASLEKFYSFYGSEENIYPNVNIYIASDSENARINLGNSSEFNVGDVNRCIYFGYIYAPYMTFYIDGQAGGNGSARAVGGLIVSDIVMGMDTQFLFAQPDMSIMGLAGKGWSALSSIASKSWRMSYGLT